MVLKYLRNVLRRTTRRGGAAEPPAPSRVRRPIPADRIDADAIKIIRRLARHGYEAYLVGGGVRDLLLGLQPKDFDIATSAKPHEVKRLFRNCRVIGRRFRLAHVYFAGGKILEVATFRARDPGTDDPKEGDLLIRQDNVFGTPQEDAARRDFTINALFYDFGQETIIDYVGGLADIEARQIRTIGDPDIRLREDPIRILRALRLSARLGCSVEPRTMDAIRRHRTDIPRAAKPRIIEDLLRMFRGGASERAFRLMRETGVLAVVFPELDAHLRGDRDQEGELEAFFASLHALDEMTVSGRSVSTAVQLGVLFAPLIHGFLAQHPEAQRDPSGHVSRFVQPIAMRLGVSRRDSDRLRVIVLALRRFVGGRKKRRFSATSFARRPFFADALDLFEVFCRASGDFLADVERWRQTQAQTGSAARQEGRRTRRPGGGGRRRGGGPRKRAPRGAHVEDI